MQNPRHRPLSDKPSATSSFEKVTSLSLLYPFEREHCAHIHQYGANACSVDPSGSTTLVSSERCPNCLIRCLRECSYWILFPIVLVMVRPYSIGIYHGPEAKVHLDLDWRPPPLCHRLNDLDAEKARPTYHAGATVPPPRHQSPHER
jgi:hypothetical protein